jgi:hypothetical protein
MAQEKWNRGNLLSKTGDKKAEIRLVTYSMYADLNESRMYILQDIKEKYGRNPDK